MTNGNIPNIPTPRNLQELKTLFSQFGPFLTPENQQLMAALINEMEKGPGNADYSVLGKIAHNMEDSANKSKENLKK